MQRSLQGRAQRALAELLASRLPGGSLDADSRVEHLEQNLVDGITPDQRELVVTQLSGGDGGELVARDGRRPKFHSAYSSAALAVNAFAVWMGHETELVLGGRSGFESIKFETKCPIGVRGKTPNLDFVALGSESVVAVESKCTEQLVSHIAEFSAVYDARVADLAHPTWQKEYTALKADPGRYTFLNAAQLVKHYLGVRNTFPSKPSTLLYLYWEPTNADDHPELVQHRAEVERFRDAVDDPLLRFEADSYPSRWDRWGALAEPAWLAAHVARLRARYETPI